ncbi:MAG: MBL fold metallo-hydrolase [Gemmatimonadota bacterium]|nr:MBL fold metallo-hydrolase [Gemmatimonadota bacterium]
MRLTVLGLVAVVAAPLAAQQQTDDVRIEVVPVAAGVHMLVGRGGNIGVSAGADGVFLIDDQFAPLTEKIVAAVRSISTDPIRFVLNTHWHGDHTGGNENLGSAGSLIVAHDNVRQRMSVEQFMEAFDRRVPASPVGALPVITFSETVTFYLNGDTLHVFHVPHAHTDGDVIIHFRTANALHMGDTFFNGRYPFIDVGSGGNVNGVIAAAEAGLAIADDATRIIPGHGTLGGRAELVAYRDMLVAARDRIGQAMAAGQTLEQIRAAKLMADYDATWGDSDGFVGFVFQSLQR